MVQDADPMHVSLAISELIAIRGLARSQGDAQLQACWDSIVGPDFAPLTRVGELSRGVLKISVANGALLSELNSFHKATLLQKLKTAQPELRLKSLKFQLQTNLRRS